MSQRGVKPEELEGLTEFFHPRDLSWRPNQTGDNWAKVLTYVTNRAIQQRLDDVVGPENWKNEFVPGPDGGVVCRLSILVQYDDGTTEWVTKEDGAENTHIESVKGGLSDSMKRAGVQFGIGRGYYKLPGAMWAELSPNGTNWDKGVGNWFPPILPLEFLPEGVPPHGEAVDRVFEAHADGEFDGQFLLVHGEVWEAAEFIDHMSEDLELDQVATLELLELITD